MATKPCKRWRESKTPVQFDIRISTSTSTISTLKTISTTCLQHLFRLPPRRRAATPQSFRRVGRQVHGAVAREAGRHICGGETRRRAKSFARQGANKREFEPHDHMPVWVHIALSCIIRNAFGVQLLLLLLLLPPATLPSLPPMLIIGSIKKKHFHFSDMST